ncbi:MAG TPA: hypothetical protein VK841_01065 [Polyangiaceae bacterium]|jgi:hypothetical protein|nr:hypothetical protein [Polyangiaceae bacterium]
MTYSGDRPGPMEGQIPAPTASELSLDDLERLAREFRPSWELDDAPFASGANFSAADVHVLQAGEARHRIRQALVTTTDEGFLSGRRDRASNHPPAAGPARVSSRPPPSRLAPPPAFALAPMRAPQLSLDSSMQARRFRRRPPWIAIGAVGAVLIGLGVWATSSSNASQAGANVAPQGTAAPPPAAQAPEPPKETQAAAPSPPPEPAAAAPSEPLPTPKPPPQEAHPVQAGPVYPSPTPAPARPVQASSVLARPSSAKPATHPKAGPTIVRDVPF